MKYAVLAARLLLGLAFVVFGLNHFLNFLNMGTPDLPAPAKSFIDAIVPTGYLSAVKVFELTGGLLLLTGVLVPLGLVLLTPVLVNIAFYDIFLMQKPGLGMAFLAIDIFLIWAYRPYFMALFTVNARPAVAK
jgi:uncharacterized membrane protein YphA (DoxX/SURF4 family)